MGSQAKSVIGGPYSENTEPSLERLSRCAEDLERELWVVPAVRAVLLEQREVPDDAAELPAQRSHSDRLFARTDSPVAIAIAEEDALRIDDEELRVAFDVVDPERPFAFAAAGVAHARGCDPCAERRSRGRERAVDLLTDVVAS